MGLIENFGRVASSYMEEKEQLQAVEGKRTRTRTGHGFWPHEVLRDAILLSFMTAVLLASKTGGVVIGHNLHHVADEAFVQRLQEAGVGIEATKTPSLED